MKLGIVQLIFYICLNFCFKYHYKDYGSWPIEGAAAAVGGKMTAEDGGSAPRLAANKRPDGSTETPTSGRASGKPTV